VDGVSFEPRREEARHGLLGILGADASGHKALVGRWDGYREREPAWQARRLALQSHGREHGPAWAMGEGALGFGKARRHGSGQTRGQRCWGHKTAHGLDKRPQDLPPQATQRLQAIWMAPDRQRAAVAFALFLATEEAKYPKAAACLAQERAVLLAFDDFPAEPWGPIRTTHPSESTFATVRGRTDQTRGCRSRVTRLAMVCKL
jgi:putative transposase